MMVFPLLCCILSSLTTIHGSDIYANMQTPFAFTGGRLDWEKIMEPSICSSSSTVGQLLLHFLHWMNILRYFYSWSFLLWLELSKLLWLSLIFVNSSLHLHHSGSILQVDFTAKSELSLSQLSFSSLSGISLGSQSQLWQGWQQKKT